MTYTTVGLEHVDSTATIVNDDDSAVCITANSLWTEQLACADPTHFITPQEISGFQLDHIHDDVCTSHMLTCKYVTNL